MKLSGLSEAAMSRTEYDRLRAQLVFAPNGWLNIATLAANLGLFLGIGWLLARGDLAAYVLAQLLLPIAMFQAFGILHDCGHGSFSRRRWTNGLVGHCASLLCGLPYLPWKYVHAEHHVWAGNSRRDPGAAIVLQARAGRLPPLLGHTWRTWLPVAGLAQNAVYWIYPVVQWRRGSLPRRRLLGCVGSVGLLVVVYACLHTIVPLSRTLESIGPGVVLYLMLVEIVNLPHHVGLTAFEERLPLWQQHLPTRSCDYPPVVSELLVLNFNFHIEHHLFPNLPWYRLRSARRIVKRALGVRYREAHGIHWLRRARRRELVDVLTHSADDFDSVRPPRVSVRQEPAA